jgi:hypothetical protein
VAAGAADAGTVAVTAGAADAGTVAVAAGAAIAGAVHDARTVSTPVAELSCTGYAEWAWYASGCVAG